MASLPGDEVQPKVPASVSSVAIASLAMSTVSGSLASSLAPIGVVSSFTPVGVTSMLPVQESRSAAELERMHTSLGALPYAAVFVERADASFVQKEKTSSGGTASSNEDVELTVRGDNASSDSSHETIELSPQVTVRGQLLDTQSYQPLRLVHTMICHSQRLVLQCLSSRWVKQQLERSPPVRSAFSR